MVVTYTYIDDIISGNVKLLIPYDQNGVNMFERRLVGTNSQFRLFLDRKKLGSEPVHWICTFLHNFLFPFTMTEVTLLPWHRCGCCTMTQKWSFYHNTEVALLPWLRSGRFTMAQKWPFNLDTDVPLPWHRGWHFIMAQKWPFYHNT